MKKYIIAIDQSTSASKVFLVNEKNEILRRFSRPHKQYYPMDGYSEHDAEEIYQNVISGIEEVSQGIDKSEIAAVSISNQRETTVFWDRATGRPLRRAIVWQDVRAGELIKELAGEKDHVKGITGLDLSPYYPAGKAAHALREDRELYNKAQGGDALIGTVDSYLIYRLTGGKSFCQDITNASRTQLFDIRKKEYDRRLCEIFGIPIHALPRVLPSDAEFGESENGIIIKGVMGDSHASLFKQGCTRPGMVKTSYGTGSSVMMNTGESAFVSGNGLSTSVAYGFKGKTEYVLEGNITHSGDTLRWLCDAAQMAASPKEVEQIALSVKDTGGVMLVPAFSGLGAPYFDTEARAAFVNLSRSSTRAHMVRAALESMAYQNADVIAAMQRDAGGEIEMLHADGGGCKNELLMQLQADLLQCPIEASDESELSALGCAMMAGMEIFGTGEIPPPGLKRYEPGISKNERDALMDKWHKAINRVLSVRGI